MSRAREEGATVRLRAASPWWRCRDSDLLEDYGDSYYPGRKITLGERFKALTHRRGVHRLEGVEGEWPLHAAE